MVTNDAGQVAIIYYQPTPRIVTIPAKPKPREYVFSVGFGVSLAWINPEDVDKVLAMKIYCCGGQSSTAFHYASEAAINVYNTGHY